MPFYIQPPQEFLENQFSQEALDKFQLKFDGIKENFTGDAVPIPVIYGYRNITGPVVWAGTSLYDTNILTAVILIGHGPISAYHKIYVDETVIPVGGIDSQNVMNIAPGPAGAYSGVLSLEFRYGGSSDPATESVLLGRDVYYEFNSEINKPRQREITALTNFLKDNNLAYVVVRLLYTENGPYRSFPRFRFDVSGANVRPANNLNSSLQAVAKDMNPADMLADYLINPVYGAGLSVSQLDPTSLAQLRADLAQTNQLYINGPVVPRGSANAIIDTGRPVIENIREMCRQFNIIINYANGLYNFKLEKNETAIFTITQNQIINQVTISAVTANLKYNQILASYPDPSQSFGLGSVTYDDTAAQTLDGSVIPVSMDFDMITDPHQVRQAANIVVNKSRTSTQYQFTGTKECLQLTVGDVISFNLTGLDAYAATLRIIQMQINEDLTVNITAIVNADYPPFDPGAKITQFSLYIPNGDTIQVISDPSDPNSPVLEPVLAPPESPLVGTVTLFNTYPPGDGATQLFKLVGPYSDSFYRAYVYQNLPNFDTVESSNYAQAQSATDTNAGNLGLRLYMDAISLTEGASVRKFYLLSYDMPLFNRTRDVLPYNYRTSTDATSPYEGILRIGTTAYDTIFYVYPIGFDNNGKAIYGTYNKLETQDGGEFEKIFFDPQSGSTDARYIRGTTAQIQTGTPQNERIIDLLLGTEVNVNQRSALGLPRLHLQTVTGFKKENGIYVNEEQGNNRGPCVSINGEYRKYRGYIPMNVWQRSQTETDLAAAQYMTLKFFVITSRGKLTYLGYQNMNIDSRRFGDAGFGSDVTKFKNYYQEIFPQSRNNTGAIFTNVWGSV